MTFLPKIKVSLDNEWKAAWKFSSVRLMALSGIAEIVQHSIKEIPQEVAQYIDPHVLSWVATVSAILAIVGRVTQVETKKDVQPPQSS